MISESDTHVFRSEVKKLCRHYGHQNWWPWVYVNHKIVSQTASERAFEVAIGAILTQNTSWQNVEKSLEALAGAGRLSLKGLSKVSYESLCDLVKASGYYRQKSKKLKALVDFVKHEAHGDLITLKHDPQIRRKLLSIWGVGPETADTILLYGLGLPFFIVDAYTRRFLVTVTGSTVWKQANYSEVQKFCSLAIPSTVSNWSEIHACLVAWGKENKTKTRKG